jgi:general secretion pathway protein E
MSPAAIDRYLLEFYTLSRSVRRAEDAEREGRAAGVQNLEQLMELGRRGELDANDQHVINIVDWLLQYAFGQRASDIHLEPRREQGNVRFRIDGVLHTVYEIPAPVLAAVTSRIKILGRMDVAEKRRPQDGRIKTRSPDGAEVELRLSSLPTAFGEKLVLRIFDPGTLVQDYHELGFSGEEERAWRGLITQPHGIVLVTGPTGSGKTTTLYSTLKVLARPEVNVCTVEDPIEMVEPAFNQMQVHHAIGLDFAAGVRTLLRQDPDIIMVGEIRDLETAEIGIKAAQTGHMVLSTLHTNSAPETLTRLVNMGVASFNIASTVTLIIAQRLARRLCTHCRREEEVPPEALLAEGFTETELKDITIFGPVGCDHCTGGYKGRVGLYEVMPVTDEIGRLIMEGGNSMEIADLARQQGVVDLRRAGLNKVRDGLTSLEEINRVTKD